MSTASVQSDKTWSALVNDTEEGREAKMAQRYQEMAALSDEDRINRMAAMATAEYELNDAQLRVFTLSRLRTWLSLEDDMAHKIARAYDAAMLKMPGPVAMRRVSLVQTLARDFSNDDRKKLLGLVPNVFAGVTDPVIPLVRREASPQAAPAAPAKKKGWWPFGRG